MSSAIESTVATPQESRTANTSPDNASTPVTSPAEDSDYEDAVDSHDKEEDEDFGGLSNSIEEEEKRIKQESKKADEEEQKQNIQQFTQEKTDDRFKRLQFLIKQSTVYSSILMEKLSKQQEEQREKAEKVDKQAAKNEEAAAAEEPEKQKVETVRKSTRSAVAEKMDEKPAAKTKKGRATRGAATGAATTNKKTQPSIADMFSKDDLKKAGAEDSTKDVLASVDEAAKPKPLKSARQPKLVTGATMREYQLQGLEWLVSLYENGLNGILADEMGLGKTLQTISFIAFLKEKGINGPFLVAAPLSTLSNWVDEFEKFTPEIPVLLYHGNPQEREEMRTKRLRKVDEKFPIVCTSYEIIMNDAKFLQKYKWKYIIIDEGHRLKNLNCRLIRELKSYDSANRLLLTGTPLQNNLSELWSLLNFLIPDIFDDLASFQGWFDFSALQEKGGHDRIIQQEAKSNIVSSLHQILKPFLLRRVKTDVETSLPKKREYILYAPLSQTQKDLYRKLLDHEAEAYLIDKILNSHMAQKAGRVPVKLVLNGKMSSASSDGTRTPKRKAEDSVEDLESLSSPQNMKKLQSLRAVKSSKKLRVNYKETSDRQYFQELEKTPEPEPELEVDQVELAIKQATKEVRNKKMQNLVMQLRLACNSPHMFYWPWGEDEPDETLVTESGKLMLLDTLVPALFKNGHKVLIFSQFTKQLDILEEWASTLRGWNTCRIDGSVKQEDRRQQIKSFNTSEDYKLFLLSTRAGGLGINLTSADTVILFDSDWNPQQDLQAQDRAHRIGQTKPVIVYRLATAATVEQTLLEKADAKRRLEKLVIQKGKFKSLTRSASNMADGDDGKTSNVDDLSKILMSDDFEKFDTGVKGQILSEDDLKVLMDRSPEAYERAEKGEEKSGGATFKAVEMKKASEQDILAEM